MFTINLTSWTLIIPEGDDLMEVVPSKETKGVLATAFGQFATREFWKSLFAMIVREAVSAFILSLGGTLVYYVRNKATQDSNNIRNITGTGVGAGAPNQTANPGNAFSNGYSPKPSYNPPPFGSSQSYPGFG